MMTPKQREYLEANRKLIDNLDDLDDVQNIYSNWTASDEVMAQLDEE